MVNLDMIEDQIKHQFDITNYDMLHAEEIVGQYVAYVGGLQAFIENQIQQPIDLKQSKDINRI